MIVGKLEIIIKWFIIFSKSINLIENISPTNNHHYSLGGDMANLNLASLLSSMLHKILSKVAISSIRDFVSARVAFPVFNEIGREDYFYRYANLIFLNDWIDKVNAVRTYMFRCYHSGNPEAFYLRGMYEYFIIHLLDEGREKSSSW